ncbi:MAG: hypothetical protein ACRCZI_07380 [Cetobacterium sp.]
MNEFDNLRMRVNDIVKNSKISSREFYDFLITVNNNIDFQEKYYIKILRPKNKEIDINVINNLKILIDKLKEKTN